MQESVKKEVMISLPSYGGYKKLTPLQKDILAEPIFSRLRHIKQLAQAYLVYPEAVHTRFTHALATAEIVKQMCDSIENSGIKEKQRNLLIAAAMLHDIGHTPFSHSTEEFLKRVKGYDDHIWWSAAIIEGKEQMSRYKNRIPEILESHGVSPTDAANLVRRQYKNEKYPYLQSLLFGSIDADTMAYLSLDSKCTIGEKAGLDIDRIINNLIIVDNKLCIKHKALYSIDQIFSLRNSMYQRVYFHHTIRIAERMLKNAVSCALDEGEIKDFYEYTDGELMVRLKESKNEAVRELAKRLEERNLFKRAFAKASVEIVRPSDDEVRLNKLRELINRKELDLASELSRRIKGLRKEFVAIDSDPKGSLLFSEPRVMTCDFNVYITTTGEVKKYSDVRRKTAESYNEELCLPEYIFIVAVPEEYVEKTRSVMEEIWAKLY